MTDAERDQLSSRLNAAFTAGAFDQETYQSRLDQLFSAQKLGQLLPVVEGLPPLQTYTNPAIVDSAGGEPGQLAEARKGTNLTLVTVAALAGVVILIVILVLLLL